MPLHSSKSYVLLLIQLECHRLHPFKAAKSVFERLERLGRQVHLLEVLPAGVPANIQDRSMCE